MSTIGIPTFDLNDGQKVRNSHLYGAYLLSFCVFLQIPIIAFGSGTRFYQKVRAFAP